MEKIRKISPVQWYLAGGVLAVLSRFVEPWSEAFYIATVFAGVGLCLVGIVKYFRS